MSEPLIGTTYGPLSTVQTPPLSTTSARLERVIASQSFGLLMVIVSLETSPATMAAGANALVMAGAASGSAVTSSVAVFDATAFGGALSEVRAPAGMLLS